jgi:hypothetical protein
MMFRVRVKYVMSAAWPREFRFGVYMYVKLFWEVYGLIKNLEYEDSRLGRIHN